MVVVYVKKGMQKCFINGIFVMFEIQIKCEVHVYKNYFKLFLLIVLTNTNIFGMLQYDPQGHLYEVLGVQNNASDQQIRQGYRAASLQWHPDQNRNNPEAATRFKEINAANQILTNQAFRTLYDQLRQRMINDSDEYIDDNEYANMDPSFRGHCESMKDIRWKMPFTWKSLKKKFHEGLVGGATLLAFNIVAKGFKRWSNALLYPRNIRSRALKNLEKKGRELIFLEEDFKDRKRSKDELKEIWGRILATQKSLIEDELDEKQQAKLYKRLAKYKKLYVNIKDDIDELSDDYQEEFKDFLKHLNKNRGFFL